jgi:hypothetical protein
LYAAPRVNHIAKIQAFLAAMLFPAGDMPNHPVYLRKERITFEGGMDFRDVQLTRML